jgi:hypothetical protein
MTRLRAVREQIKKIGQERLQKSLLGSRRAGPVTLCSQAKSSSFWILLLLACQP